MGRPKGSKNKPKPLSPDAAAAIEYAKAHGFTHAPPPLPAAATRPRDFRHFLEITKIKGKRQGSRVTLVPNDEQEDIIAAWEAGGDDGIAHLLALKPRKIGVTTIITALFVYAWLTADDPITVMYLANKRATASEIMAMVRTFLVTLPAEMRPRLTTDQAQKICREDPEHPGEDGATFVVETARGEGGIRGATPHLLAISEANFCRGAEELKASAFGAVPTEEGGRIVLESTASHIGDVLHQEMLAAQAGVAEVPWRVLFFAWWQHEAYRLPAPDFVRTAEEEALADRYQLDDQQLSWRRNKIALMGERMFRREFPASVDDAYASLAGAWFRSDQLEHLAVLEVQPEGTVILEPYDPRERYAAAGDCGAGVGGDFTTLVVLNVRTRRPAALYRSNMDTPAQSVDAMWHLLRLYGGCMVLIERNTWGIPHLNALRGLRALMYQEQSHETDGQAVSGEARDFVTTQKSRLEVLENFRTEVLSGAISLVDSICHAEMRAAKIDQDGQIVFPRTKDGHGDVLMAYALALRCARHVPVPTLVSDVARELARRRLEREMEESEPGGRY